MISCNIRLAFGCRRFGSSGINGNQNDDNANQAGAAYVFTRVGSSWSQHSYLKASNTDSGDFFGYLLAVSADGHTLAVGAWGEDSGATGVNGAQLINAVSNSAVPHLTVMIGASYGGVPSLTATSGPGLALMTEAMGLAVASETPAVVVNVMRGGPSTGIPTKSEQSDLNIAVYGLHGDAPHLVLAPLAIGDCRSDDFLQYPGCFLGHKFKGI